MNLISSWVVRIGRQGRCAVGGLVLALTSSLGMGSSMSKAAADEPGRASPGAASFPFATVSAGKLLGNFLDLSSRKRLGPLAHEVEKHKILDAFGREKGEAIWTALQAKGWIAPRSTGREAAMQRTARYGWNHFDGALAPFGD